MNHSAARCCLAATCCLAGWALPHAATAEAIDAAVNTTTDAELDDPSTTGGGGPWRFTVEWENDSSVFIPNSPSDRDYTNGTGITFSWRPRFAERAAEKIPELWGDFGDAPATAFGIQAAQLIFTPENLEVEAPQPEQRPYAGLIFVGGYWQRAGDKVFDHVQLDLGALGPSSGAEQAQEFFHDVFPDSVDPNGWNNQIADEPALQLTLRRKWRSNPDAATFHLGGLPIQVQGIAGVELEAGNVLRQLEGQLMARAGYRLPDDFGPGRIFEPASFTGNPPEGWSFYVFGRLSGRVVEHNVFLDGSDFREPDHPTVSNEPFVGEAAAGVAAGYRRGGWSVGLNYAQVYLTQEYVEQDDAHSYGRYSLSIQRRF